MDKFSVATSKLESLQRKLETPFLHITTEENNIRFFLIHMPNKIIHQSTLISPLTDQYNGRLVLKAFLILRIQNQFGLILPFESHATTIKMTFDLARKKLVED